MEEELQRAAQALYALPFDDFIAARTAAAKDAAASDKPLAQAIRTLPKPSVAAWTVNMLAHHRPEAVQQLRVLGQSMQEAQASLDAAALRELAKERRRLLGTAVGEARLAAEEQGRKISGPVATEVEETLRAATADLAAAAAVESGLLLRGLSADGVDQVIVTDAVAVPSALGKLPPRPLPPQRPSGAQRPIGVGPKGHGEEPSATAAPAGRRARTQPPKAADKTDTDTEADAEAQEKPRLRAVRSAPRPVPPSLLEKAQAALAEAEEAAADAAGEAARRAQAQEDAAAAFVQLTADVNEARQRLRALELSLDAARKQRETSAAEAKQYARAAEKSARSAVLAKERVLRLRNTPD